MEIKFLKRNILQRLFGISATKMPGDNKCWTYSDRKLVIELKRAPELSLEGGAIRLEGKNLPDRILVIHGDDGVYHTFRNRCKHMGRRLDPVFGDQTVQCCSINKSTYSYDGEVVYGPARKPVETFAIQVTDGKLFILLDDSPPRI
ncbi:MAG: Rieske 2Fe-2S domain-containing protein [Syntrophobacteraceae bacterium]|jgi:nitrite reductase/ring-hydroxylating ferredoxin subunit